MKKNQGRLSTEGERNALAKKILRTTSSFSKDTLGREKEIVKKIKV